MPPPESCPPRHALSVDVEDWYHDGGVGDLAAAGHRVERNTDRLLELFEAHGARATFFFLGEVGERFPALVRRVAAGGHELGSHGHRHRPVSQLLRREFRDDVERSLSVLQECAGVRVRGYRAPYFSIKAGVRWPIETLAGLGLQYDSSILAIDRPPGLELVCPRRPFRHDGGIWEMPVGVLKILFWNLPLASGSGLRLFPHRLWERALRRFEREIGAGVFYLHPWEIDPGSPTGPGVGRQLFLRTGRERLPARLGDLLRVRTFAPIAEVFDAELRGRSLA